MKYYINLNICLSATSSNICDGHAYIHHVMLTFSTFISFCCVFWIACQRSGATKFPPNGDAIQPPPKPVGNHNNLPRGALLISRGSPYSERLRCRVCRHTIGPGRRSKGYTGHGAVSRHRGAHQTICGPSRKKCFRSGNAVQSGVNVF